MCYKKRKVFCKKRNKKNKKAKKETNKESVKKHFVESQSNNWATRSGKNMKNIFITKKMFLLFFEPKKDLDHQLAVSG